MELLASSPCMLQIMHPIQMKYWLSLGKVTNWEGNCRQAAQGLKTHLSVQKKKKPTKKEAEKETAGKRTF